METCFATLRKRGDAAWNLLRERIQAAEESGTQLIVFNHYPSSYLAPGKRRSSKLESHPACISLQSRW